MSTMLKYEKSKAFLEKFMLRIGVKIFLLLKKSTIVEHWPYVIEELNGEEFIGMLYENELKKTDKTTCEIGRL